MSNLEIAAISFFPIGLIFVTIYFWSLNSQQKKRSQLGSQFNPHIYQSIPFRPSSAYPPSKAKSEALDIAQVWREKHLNNRFEWVLFYIESDVWNEFLGWTTPFDYSGMDIYDTSRRLVFRLTAKREEGAQNA